MPTSTPPAATATPHPAHTLRCDIARGPNWLFVHLHPLLADVDDAEQAREWREELLAIAECHFTYRLVVEMDQVESLSEEMQQELALLGSELHRRQGALRICGMNQECQERLHPPHDIVLRNHLTRRDAVHDTDSTLAPRSVTRNPR